MTSGKEKLGPASETPSERIDASIEADAGARRNQAQASLEALERLAKLNAEADIRRESVNRLVAGVKSAAELQTIVDEIKRHAIHNTEGQQNSVPWSVEHLSPEDGDAALIKANEDLSKAAHELAHQDELHEVMVKYNERSKSLRQRIESLEKAFNIEIFGRTPFGDSVLDLFDHVDSNGRLVSRIYSTERDHHLLSTTIDKRYTDIEHELDELEALRKKDSELGQKQSELKRVPFVGKIYPLYWDSVGSRHYKTERAKLQRQADVTADKLRVLLHEDY